jgi:hypothetical protein
MLADCAHAETHEPLNYLVLKGQESGFLSQRQMFDTFPDLMDSSEQLTALYLTLEDDGMLGPADAAIDEGEDHDEDFFVDEIDADFNVDDTVALYLKEISRIPLLTGA